tara:strand:+ start:1672 stop:1860 length:189 start_codon:yes stop_codon:yes gene_type:complete
MFVQSKAGTSFTERSGVAIKQRRGNQETLVQWSNGDQRWVPTADLAGEIRLIGDKSEEYHNG